MSAAVSAVIDACTYASGKESKCISATGAHGLVESRENPRFSSVLRSFYLNLPDGVPLVWAGRLKGAKGIERCYGPDFFALVIEKSAQKNIHHYFCGGKQGVAEDLRIVCEQKYGNKNCVGTFSPPFRDMTDDEIALLADDINRKQADIVWIGLSTPKQEFFARRLSESVKVHFIITVGAAFDFRTGRKKQAPRFVQKMGLEWFFRLLMEPRRLGKRYCKIVPLFVFYVIKDFITHR